jgi:peptidoglycan/xylan/chitin deacetylase (PgdA/CDA1 family)
MAHRLPILTYHSVDGSGSVISTSPAVFRAQIEFLAKSGYSGLTLSQALPILRGAACPVPGAVAITFDDGFQSVCTEALPVLEDHGFKATVFLVSDYLGSAGPWLQPDAGFPRFPLMRADGAERLLASGWEFGGHSATHAHLTGLTDDELDRELQQCKSGLRRLCGLDPFWFAYPYGEFDRRVQDGVRLLFGGACGTRLGYASAQSDLYALERVDMYYLRHARIYRSFGCRRLAAYLRLRSWARTLRGPAAAIRSMSPK